MPKKVLIVEDESITALELKRKLMHWGYEISATVDTGKKAVETALELEPDLILMDIVLKGDLDGIKAFKKIKKSLDIPIIYITAHSDENTLNRAQETDPFGYILKPIDDKDLKFTIEMALFKHTTESKLKRLNQSLRVLSDCNQEIIRANDEDKLRKRICEIIATEGNYKLTWINFIDEKDKNKLVTVAKYPNQEFYDESIDLNLSDQLYESYPAVSNIKNREITLCQDITLESPGLEWVSYALEKGYNSLISIPLILEEKIIGSMNIYSSKKNRFDIEEVALLNELANDVVYGINVIRSRLEREKIKKNLKKSEEKYRCIVETANEGIMAMDKNFTTTFVNKKMCELLGYTAEEIINKPVDYFIFEEDLKDHYDRMNMRKNGLSQQYERKFRHKNGKTVWLLISATALTDKEGNFNGSFAMFTDISENKLAFEKLKTNEEKYRSLYSTINEGMAFHQIIYNEEGKAIDYEILDVNPAYEQILNLKKDDVIGKRASEIYSSGKPPYINIYSEVTETGHSKTFETYYAPFNKYFAISVFSPSLNKFVTIFEDITEQKNVEKVLQESERRLNAVLQGSPIPTFVIDQNHKVIYWNKAVEKYTKIKAEDIVGTDNQWTAFYDNKRPVMADLLIDGDIEELSKWYKGKYSRSKFAEDAYNSTDFFPQLDKKGKWLYFTAAPIKDATGIVIGAMETLEDITPRKNAEMALQESEERYRRLLKQSFDAVLIHSDGKIISINDTGARILGAVKEEIIGRPLFNFIHPDYHDLVEDRIKKVSNNQNIVPLVEQKFLKIDGTPIDVEVVGTGFVYNGKNAVQSVFRDISQRKEYESQIINSLKEKDVLLKEVHHRVKNNMQIISSLLNLQGEYCDGPTCEIFNESKNRVKSMAIVHEKLYQSEDFSGINFKEYIQSLTSEILASYLVDTNRIKVIINVENIKLNINTAIPVGLILNEMVTNCIKHAFPNDRRGLIEISLYPVNKEYELTIKDNGVGFPKGFDLKNTKTLGMELIKSLVKQLEGELTIEKEPYTVFRLRFRELKYEQII
ncbi:MAG: PAS domain S-box protein [Methanobacteriaceae archaeon]|nr:PAS domain S-box protein [Methanobacteriaceae archaeon]